MPLGKKKRVAEDEGKTTEVDIAPLIDVVFLLIVFFMSIWQAAHIEVKAELSLPDASQGNPELQQDRDRLIVNVDEGGAYYVASARISKETLAALLTREAKMARAPDGFSERQVFIRADADLPFKKVLDVMLMCRDVGIWQLRLRTKGRVEEGP